MPLALSLAWRLLLAVALVASPIIGLASECGFAQASMQATQATRSAQAMPDTMPGCAQMADMAPKAPQGKPDPAGGSTHHAGCMSSACCLGGAVGMSAFALHLDAPPARPLRADFNDSALAAPPRGSLLRPPIA